MASNNNKESAKNRRTRTQSSTPDQNGLEELDAMLQEEAEYISDQNPKRRKAKTISENTSGLASEQALNPAKENYQFASDEQDTFGEYTDGEQQKIKKSGGISLGLAILLLAGSIGGGWFAWDFFGKQDNITNNTPQNTLQNLPPSSQGQVNSNKQQTSDTTGTSGNTKTNTPSIPASALKSDNPADKVATQPEIKIVPDAKTENNNVENATPGSKAELPQNYTEEKETDKASVDDSATETAVASATPEGSNKTTHPSPPPVNGNAEDAASKNTAEHVGNSGVLLLGSSKTTPNRSTRIAAKQPEDSMVSIRAVEDLAALLATSYWPENTWPGRKVGVKQAALSTSTVKNLNLRYGTSSKGLNVSGTPEQLRIKILSYAFTPFMLGALENIYGQRLVDSLEENSLSTMRTFNGKERPLTITESKAMLYFYAKEFRKTASALHNYASYPGAGNLVKIWIALEQKTYASNLAYAEILSEINEHREHKTPLPEGVTQAKADAMGQEYRKNLRARQDSYNAVIGMMSRDTARQLDANTLSYIAAWAMRRGDNSIATLRSSSAVLGKIADRMEKAANKNKEESGIADSAKLEPSTAAK